MQDLDFTWKIGGEAGFGIMITGTSFAKVCTRSGLNIITNNEYPSLIRGGHNNFTVRAASDKIYSLLTKINLLVALNRQTIDLHKNELAKNAAIIFDPNDYQPQSGDLSENIEPLPLPLLQLARDNGGDIIMRNTVALGASLAYLGIDFKVLEEVLNDQFIHKGPEIVAQNIKMAKVGFDYLANNLKKTPLKVTRDTKETRLVLSGNEAIGLGALSAGMKFFTAYPMTPINGLITLMAENEKKLGIVYKQPEDEISGINMAIGASYAGVRAMTATSGGGFALMNEAFSMAGMTETPLVVVLGQRPGPASGLPTWTSQGDLRYALSAGHGEFLRFVLTPGDMEEAYFLSKLAFNLADKYQTPAIILVDKYFCECLFSLNQKQLDNPTALLKSVADYANSIDRGKIVNNPDETYQRFKITDDGISPRAFPGHGMHFTVNSYEHNEAGLSTEVASEIKAMTDKRSKKNELAQAEAFGPMVYGEEKADITLVGWGSTKMAVLEALKIIKDQKVKLKVNYLHFLCLSPFPGQNTAMLLQKAKKVIDVETNSQAPLAGLIREKTGIEIKNKILKYDGRQFYPEEILSALNVIEKE
ncbi:2-oxoacid:acceptor oxidoreductase subunit alpha [Candidatus Gottesmanbacteria bacterium]|nr:2-oxoacid:acceptor oxidoreductase subunit alpha [Candidatus Gottesmanbacteria bacterium]